MTPTSRGSSERRRPPAARWAERKGLGEPGLGPGIREAGRTKSWAALPSAAPLDFSRAHCGAVGAEVGGPPVPVMLLRRGRGRSGRQVYLALGLGGPGTGAPAPEARCSAPPARSRRDSAPVDPLLCPPCPTPPRQLTHSRVLRVCSHSDSHPMCHKACQRQGGRAGAPIITPWVSKAWPLGLFRSAGNDTPKAAFTFSHF